jgi:hypothetical protein
LSSRGGAVLELGSRGDPPRSPARRREVPHRQEAGRAGPRRCSMRGAKLLGIGAAIAILLVDAGNSGQVGLSQGQILPVRTLGFYGVTSVVFSPDGRYLAVGTWGGSSVQLIDTSRWQVIRTFEGHTDSVNSVAFSPDGWLLASGSVNQPRRTRSSCGMWPQEADSAHPLIGSRPHLWDACHQSLPWRSAPTGGCWPPAPRTGRSSCGM